MTAENVNAALRYIEDMELPFTSDSFTELVNKLKLFFEFMEWLDDAPLDEQNRKASWLIQACRLFLAKVIKCYPLLFVSDVGDEVGNEVKSFGYLYFCAHFGLKICSLHCCKAVGAQGSSTPSYFLCVFLGHLWGVTVAG